MESLYSVGDNNPTKHFLPQSKIFSARNGSHFDDPMCQRVTIDHPYPLEIPGDF